MKILFTGATGVLGRASLPLLTAAGHEVTAATRSVDDDTWLNSVGAYDYSEIADIVDRSPANCRKIASRARERAGDTTPARPPRETELGIIDRYVAAVSAGDVDQLAQIFADDVVLWSDGGGKARAARHPIFGAQRVARHLVGVTPRTPAGTQARVVRANGVDAEV